MRLQIPPTSLSFLILLSFQNLAVATSLRVRVVDSLNASVADARVTAGDGPAVLTGPDGAARVEVAGPIVLRVEREGFEPVDVRLSSAAGEEIAVRLRPAVVRNSIDVVVRDEPIQARWVSTAMDDRTPVGRGRSSTQSINLCPARSCRGAA
jgi:hypothetical protein